MLRNLLAGFQLIHGLVLAAAAVGLFKFWKRTRFWLPAYIHVLAGIGLIISVLAVTASPSDAPINKNGPFVRLLVMLALPVIIYLFFVVYGGQRAAFHRSFSMVAPCPFCQNQVRVAPEHGRVPNDSPRYLGHECPHCGHVL